MRRRTTAGGLLTPEASKARFVAASAVAHVSETPARSREAESFRFCRFLALFVTHLKHGVAVWSKTSPIKRESCNCVCKRVAELSAASSNRGVRKDRVGACLQRVSDLSDVPCGSALRLRPHKGFADLL